MDLVCKVCGADRRGDERCSVVTHAEADTVKRIVAWLRAERDAWSISTEAREICASLAWVADAIERGDWRNGGDNRG